MSRFEVERIAESFPEALGKTYLLREFEKNAPSLDVPDPARKEFAVYESTRDLLRQVLPSFLKFVDAPDESIAAYNSTGALVRNSKLNSIERILGKKPDESRDATAESDQTKQVSPKPSVAKLDELQQEERAGRSATQGLGSTTRRNPSG